MSRRDRQKKSARRINYLFAAMVLIFLYAPVAVMILFSFNNSHANVVWSGFTFDYYKKLFTDKDMWEVFLDTIVVAGGSTILGTIIGTSGAVGFRNTKFRGKKLISTSIYFPLVIPEIVLAAAMLMLFNMLSIKLSIWTVIIGNTTLVLPYVFINVRARLAGMDPSMEEASMDLGAGRLYTFFHVTLPAILPGVYAGAFMSFSLTIDELIITSFLADAETTTLPVRVYSMLKRGISPEINALTTIILLVSFIGVGVYAISGMGKKKRSAKLAKAAQEAGGALQSGQTAGTGSGSGTLDGLDDDDYFEEEYRRVRKTRIRTGVSLACLLVLLAFAGNRLHSVSKGKGPDNGVSTADAAGSLNPEDSGQQTASAKDDYGTDTLNLLIWSGFWSEEVFNDFEKETGVKINVSYIDNTDVLLAKLLEGSADYDVIDLETGYVEPFIKNGLLAKINKDNVPNRFNIQDKYLSAGGAPVGDQKEEYVIPDMAPLYTTILYNKETCPIKPERLSDLADPRLKGQVALVNSTISLYGGALADLGYPPDSIDPQQMQEAQDLLLKIKPNVKAFVGESAASQLKSGECSVAFCWDFNVLCAESRDNWDKFVFVQPKAGVENAPQYWAIPGSSKHKEAAEAFINFECRPEESSKNLNEYGGEPILKKELIAKYLPDDYYDSPVFEANAKAFENSWKIAVRDEQQALMDKYYTELMSGVSVADE